MSKINYQVVKLMLLFASDEHALCKRISNEIYNHMRSTYRKESFIHSGEPIYLDHQSMAINERKEQVKIYDALSRESLVLARNLQVLLDELNQEWKFETTHS